MAGCITYLHPEVHSDGGWIPPLVLSEQVKKQICNLIVTNREFTESEKESISRHLGVKKEEVDKEKIELEHILTIDEITSMSQQLANIRFMRTGFKDATAQEVKRTLASYSRLSPFDAIVQYGKSDTSTQALIDEALCCDLGLAGADLLSPTGESIKQAAKIAFQNLTPGRAGHPIKYYRKVLAEYTIFLWGKLGMEPCKPWHNDVDAAPIVQFMNVLVIIVDGKSIDFSDAVTLLKKQENR